MLNLFIDTNIYLNFYDFQNEQLAKLEIIVALIKEKKIKLFIPQQVVDEFKRNRENKLYVSIKYLEGLNPLKANFTDHGVPGLGSFQEELKKNKESLEKIKEDVVKQSISNTLPADKIVASIFVNSVIALEEDLLKKAKGRFDRGNPPRKPKNSSSEEGNSYGDAINWETLLKYAPTREELYVVSSDGDYGSPLRKGQISEFLRDEWKEVKNSKVILYTTISEFLKDKFPDAKITKEEVEAEKSSSRFSSTLSSRLSGANVTTTRNEIYNSGAFLNAIISSYIEDLQNDEDI